MTDRVGVFRVILKDLEGISIVTVEPILSADPEIACAILEEGQPCILRETILNGEMFKSDDAAWSDIRIAVKT